MELVESPVDQPQLVRCEIASELNKAQAGTWAFFYGEAGAATTGGWEGLRARTGCEAGASDEALASKQWVLRGAPYLLVDVTARRRSAKNGPELLEMSLSRRRLSGFSTDGKPSYARTEEKRLVPIKESVAIPLMISDQKESGAFRAHDVLLRVTASTPTRTATFGEVSLVSDTPRADILLDGGVVARTLEGTPTLLENVPVGERELRVRDFSGHEARQVVRVRAEKPVQVMLNLRQPVPSGAEKNLVPLGKNTEGYEEYWRTKDGAPVVKVPAEEFLMGSAEREPDSGEHPPHKVTLSSYLIDKTEVTWGQYAKFSKASGTPLPEAPLWGTPDDYPVTAVTWPEAAAFCEWVGGRLPTEAEWEKAARGTDERRYPYGNEFDPDRCNTRDGGPHRPREVGAFPGCVSPYGVLDMSGGVWEFCHDWYQDKPDLSTATARDPKGPASGERRVIRGASWLNPDLWARTTFRQGTEPTWRDVLHGFRCVQEVRE
jgi:formylglycine-generating enzyme required for sulfatase activity